MDIYFLLPLYKSNRESSVCWKERIEYQERWKIYFLTEHISQNNQRRQAKRIGNYINKKEYEA